MNIREGQMPICESRSQLFFCQKNCPQKGKRDLTYFVTCLPKNVQFKLWGRVLKGGLGHPLNPYFSGNAYLKGDSLKSKGA